MTTLNQQLKDLLKTLQDNKNELSLLNKQLDYIQSNIKNFDPSEYVSEEAYDNMLDEINEETEICGMIYRSSYALEQVDPTAYRVGFSDYVGSYDLEDIKEYQDLKLEEESMEEEIQTLEEEIESIEEEINDLELEIYDLENEDQ